MLIFYLISAVINLGIFAGFMFRYRQTSARPYLHIGLAILANAIAAALMAFLGDMLFDSLFVSLAIIYVSAIIGSISGLVLIMVVLGLLRTWVESMRTGVRPAVNKLDMAEKICRYLRIGYPVLTLLTIVFFVLIIVSLGFAGILVMVVGFAFWAAAVCQVGVIIWMYIDLHGDKATNDSEIRKRNQLLKLGGLSFFGCWPAMLAGLGVGIGGAVCFWVWYVIALWPGALIGFEDKVQASGVHPGMMEQKYDNAPSHQGSYQASTYHAQQAMYGNGAGGGAAPQASYQPQHHQPYGGQPAQNYQHQQHQGYGQY